MNTGQIFMLVLAAAILFCGILAYAILIRDHKWKEKRETVAEKWYYYRGFSRKTFAIISLVAGIVLGAFFAIVAFFLIP